MNKLVAHISEVDDVDDCLIFCLLMLAVRERGKNVPLLVDSHLMNSLSVVANSRQKAGQRCHVNLSVWCTTL